MQKCWKEDPAVRPAFKMISQELKKLENTGKVKHKKYKYMYMCVVAADR